MDYSFWDSGQPDNHNSITGEPEDCLVLRHSSKKWNDIKCRLEGHSKPICQLF